MRKQKQIDNVMRRRYDEKFKKYVFGVESSKFAQRVDGSYDTRIP